ncbi:SDR family oxidoreductase, partial [Micromonospora andamanensis]|uniref:SDR family oxidoreductase n=1 Tax=Micromonospora andamanensis TaxID=1287068 RepID=UPI0035EEB73D
KRRLRVTRGHAAQVKDQVSGAPPNGYCADLGEADQLLVAFQGLTSLCFTMPLVYDRKTVRRYARNVAEAAVKAGVRRVVFNSNTRIPPSPTDVAGFETRRDAEMILRESGLPVVVIRPTIYLENLLAPAVLHGIETDGVLAYPVPAEARIAWLGLRDLGAVAAAVLEREDVTPPVIEVGGADLTGPELAGHISHRLGRELAFVSVAPRDFEAGLAKVLGEDAARGVAGLYHWLQRHPDSGLMSGSETQARAGIEPTSIIEWAEATWPSSSNGADRS